MVKRIKQANYKEGQLLDKEALMVDADAHHHDLHGLTDHADHQDSDKGGGKKGKAPKTGVEWSRGEIIFGVGAAKAKQTPRPKTKKMSDEEYYQLIAPLHIELVKLQNWVRANGLKVLVIFEGRDAGGKGGTIKRVTEHMNPRAAKVVALDKPTERERTQWYFQRYVTHLPAGGDITLFDRSWYNRSGVERVMGFCNKDEVKEFLRSAPQFEHMITASGIKLIKLWFSVNKEEQLRRFNSRRDDPLKQWKLSPVDKESQDRWDDYTVAKEDMFYYTSSPHAPWTIIKSDNKKLSRLEAIRFLLSQFDYEGKDPKLTEYDHRIVRNVNEEMNFD